jgi:GNAT superfamily N-acetyltransferase
MIPTSPPLLAPGFHAVPTGHVAAIVTALEMTTTPPGPPRPLPTEVGLRRVERPALDWYRRLFRAIGQAWLWTSRLTWSDETLAATVHAPEVEVGAVVPVGAELADAIGLVELDFRESGRCEIAFFGLVPGWTGRGLGRPLMQAALDRAWRAPGVERVWIHTCTLDDPRALGFYLSCGFKAYARQVEILPDPRLRGLLPMDAAPAHPVITDP